MADHLWPFFSWIFFLLSLHNFLSEVIYITLISLILGNFAFPNLCSRTLIPNSIKLCNFNQIEAKFIEIAIRTPWKKSKLYFSIIWKILAPFSLHVAGHSPLISSQFPHLFLVISLVKWCFSHIDLSKTCKLVKPWCFLFQFWLEKSKNLPSFWCVCCRFLWRRRNEVFIVPSFLNYILTPLLLSCHFHSGIGSGCNLPIDL